MNQSYRSLLLNHVENASLKLASGNHASVDSGDKDQLLFTGLWHDAYPAILTREPTLPDSAKIQLLYLMQAVRDDPNAVHALPSIDQTARNLGKSRTTVIRDRALLRMTRWAVECRRVRDSLGRMRGLVWQLPGEPVSLAVATELDPDYMALVERAAAGHYDRQAREVARLVLAAIDYDIREGRDPLGPVDPLAQRLEAAKTIQTGHGRSYATFHAPEEADSAAQGPNLGPEIAPGPLGPKFGPSAEQGPNFGPCSQVIDSIDTDQGPNFGPSVRSSSSSSNNNKTTTTNTVSNPNRETADTPALRWPHNIDDNHQRVLVRKLRFHLPDRPGDWQRVIDALALKLTDTQDPIRNYDNYLYRLCERAKAGELCPVEPPAAPQAGRPQEGTGPDIAGLRGEIGALRQLIEASRGHGPGEQVHALEAQLAQRQARLRELEQTRH